MSKGSVWARIIQCDTSMSLKSETARATEELREYTRKETKEERAKGLRLGRSGWGLDRRWSLD